MSTLARRRLGDWAWIGAAVVIAVIAAWTLNQVQHQEDRIEALYTALEAEQEAAKDNGQTPVAPSPEDLVEDPEAEVELIPGPPGPPPSDEQVALAVADYFEQHPVRDGESPSPAAIAAAVTNYLAEHPPEEGEPGPPPSAEQVAAAVEEYLTANPPAPGSPGEDGEDGAEGPAGPQGPPGPGPTPAEIAAAVEAYLIEHPLPICPAGSGAETHTVLTTGGAVEVIVCATEDQEEN